MLVVLLAGVAVLLVATSAVAEDTATIMAALNDVESECRYLDELCGEVRSLRNVYRSTFTSLQRVREKEDLERFMRRSEADAWKEARRAVDMLRVKHAEPPKCMAACEATLDDNDWLPKF